MTTLFWLPTAGVLEIGGLVNGSAAVQPAAGGETVKSIERTWPVESP
jgi:hypothetical protein